MSTRIATGRALARSPRRRLECHATCGDDRWMSHIRISWRSPRTDARMRESTRTMRMRGRFYAHAPVAEKPCTTMRYLRASAQTLKLIEAGCLRQPRWMRALEGLAPVRARQDRYTEAETVSNHVRTLPVSESSVRKKLLRQLRRRLAIRHPEWLGHVVVDLSVKSRFERDFMEKFVHTQAELMLTQRVSEDEAYQRTLALLKSELPGVHHSVAVNEEQAQDSGETARSSTLFEQLVIPKTCTERTGKDPEEVFRASWIDAQRDRWLFDQIHRRLVR